MLPFCECTEPFVEPLSHGWKHGVKSCTMTQAAGGASASCKQGWRHGASFCMRTCCWQIGAAWETEMHLNRGAGTLRRRQRSRQAYAGRELHCLIPTLIASAGCHPDPCWSAALAGLESTATLSATASLRLRRWLDRARRPAETPCGACVPCRLSDRPAAPPRRGIDGH